MGRGRAKAKQAKVARQLKYSGGGTDLDRLAAEMGVSTKRQSGAADGARGPRDDADDEEYDQYSDYDDGYDDLEEDEEDRDEPRDGQVDARC